MYTGSAKGNRMLCTECICNLKIIRIFCIYSLDGLISSPILVTRIGT
jgi:hypothetical protein